MDVIWNLSQEARLAEIKHLAETAGSNASTDAKNAVENLTLRYVQQLDRMKLVNQAIWSLLKEHSGLTDEDLLHRITELDMEDGKLDGRKSLPAPDCPTCGAKMSRKFNRCLFCGEPIPDPDPFDPV